MLYGTILSDHILVMAEMCLQLAPDIEHRQFNAVSAKFMGLLGAKMMYFMSLTYKQNT